MERPDNIGRTGNIREFEDRKNMEKGNEGDEEWVAPTCSRKEAGKGTTAKLPSGDETWVQGSDS